eukprot:NODE_6592_length_198_cov_23.765101_g5921_i0.p2 GENE.NODE_6592_length_198_cov_23.765101_g5921_i0~~NODE_6592_length_198_cov_23.765101_g5921_i0.p2  ORF type:complete len:52 (+),score=10.11 NODE_6592_length_198_cov_23.765101_g5921_i0:29-184(+)
MGKADAVIRAEPDLEPFRDGIALIYLYTLHWADEKHLYAELKKKLPRGVCR